jgi:CheY-like chemotaxis protein
MPDSDRLAHEGRSGLFRPPLEKLEATQAASSYPVAMDSESDLHLVASRVPLKGVRVLVVDDSEEACEALKALLEAEGASVSVSSSAATALDHVDQHLPDVMLVDIGMPVVNGFELVELLRNRPAHRGGEVPVAALTGYMSTEDRKRAVDAGFQAYLVKPVNPSELIDTVKSLARPEIRP